jgi:hypothetical protein
MTTGVEQQRNRIKRLEHFEGCIEQYKPGVYSPAEKAVLLEKFQLVLDACERIKHSSFFPQKFVLLKLTKDPTPYSQSAQKVKDWDDMWAAIDGDTICSGIARRPTPDAGAVTMRFQSEEYTTPSNTDRPRAMQTI